jgi:hypothetical protein
MTEPVNILELLTDEERRRLVLGVRPIVVMETVAMIDGQRRRLPHSEPEHMYAVIGYGGTPACGYLLHLAPNAYQALEAAEVLSVALGGALVEDLTADDGLSPPPG